MISCELLDIGCRSGFVLIGWKLSRVGTRLTGRPLNPSPLGGWHTISLHGSHVCNEYPKKKKKKIHRKGHEFRVTPGVPDVRSDKAKTNSQWYVINSSPNLSLQYVPHIQAVFSARTRVTQPHICFSWTYSRRLLIITSSVPIVSTFTVVMIYKPYRGCDSIEHSPRRY